MVEDTLTVRVIVTVSIRVRGRVLGSCAVLAVTYLLAHLVTLMIEL